ncbi:MAG: hypothetical protein GEU91_18665 [Rhizobiales bacterium]|nr:hypothetical protein [Hyphomicrobiales bacterium]
MDLTSATPALAGILAGLGAGATLGYLIGRLDGRAAGAEAARDHLRAARDRLAALSDAQSDPAHRAAVEAGYASLADYVASRREIGT